MSDPEQYINPYFVEWPAQYEYMLEMLGKKDLLVLDCETVGKANEQLFIEQWELLDKNDKIKQENPLIVGIITELEEFRQEKRNYDTYIKNKYDVKTVTIKILTITEREHLTSLKKKISDVTKNNPIIETYIKNEKMINKLQKKIDTFTDALFFSKNKLGLIQVGDLECQYLIDPHLTDTRFKDLLMAKSLIVMNGKFDAVQLYFHKGIELHRSQNYLYDIMLAAKVIYGGMYNRFNLQVLAERHLNYFQDKEEAVSYWAGRPLKDDQVKYACLDVITPYLIFEVLRKEIREHNLQEQLKLHLDFLKVLIQVEINGMYVDLLRFKELQLEVDQKIQESRQYLADELGDTIWFNETEQCEELKLTKDLGSPPQTVRLLQEYGKRHGIEELINISSSSKNVFDQIETDIPILDKIKEFRSLTHTRDNYLAAIEKYNVDSRIHSSYIQLQKEATRSSSTMPNLQNIPKPETNGTPAQKLREGFIASPGYKLYDSDYSMIELRVMAYLAQDPTMMQAFLDVTDLHALYGKNAFGLECSLDDVKNLHKEKRNVGKTCNFLVGYGGGIARLESSLRQAGIFNYSRNDIWGFRESWFQLFSTIKTWQESVLHFARTNGYITTLTGRNIYFQNVHSLYSKIFNCIVQSSAFEGLLKGMIILQKKIYQLEREGTIQKDDIKLCTYVHDELVVEARETLSEEFIIELIESSLIEGMQPLLDVKEIGDYVFKKVPVTCDTKCVKTWAEKA